MTTVLHIALYRLRVFAPPADRPAPNALAGRTASSWRRSSRARSGRSYFTACNMGLEGLVSKRRDRPYQAGRSKHWVKIKNRRHPAMDR